MSFVSNEENVYFPDGSWYWNNNSFECEMDEVEDLW